MTHQQARKAEAACQRHVVLGLAVGRSNSTAASAGETLACDVCRSNDEKCALVLPVCRGQDEDNEWEVWRCLSLLHITTIRFDKDTPGTHPRLIFRRLLCCIWKEGFLLLLGQIPQSEI